MSDQFWNSINSLSSITQEFQNSIKPIREMQKLRNDQMLLSSIFPLSILPLKNQISAIMNPDIVNLLQCKELKENISAIIGWSANQSSKVVSESMSLKMSILPNIVSDLQKATVTIYPDDTPEDEEQEIIESDSKIITEIFKEDVHQKSTLEAKSDNDAIIVLSPVNEQILKYLSENPEALYQLQPEEFEMVMAEIYSKLGYNVERTQTTRDGGKDIIIRKPSILGDFIYYVECKKYAPKRPIGIGIVRGMVGTINTDKVNGGIIATTSYFTRDARQFILGNNLNYQVQMHDFEKIKTLMNRVVK